MINSYTHCVNFFRIMALQDPDINMFFVGEDVRLQEAQRSSIEYPYLWLEFADPQFISPNRAAITRRYDCRILVVSHTTLDDMDGQELILQQAEDIMTRILLRMRELHKEQKILFSLDRNKLQRVSISNADNAWGWEMRVSIGDFLQPVCTDASIRHDAKAYTPVCPDPVTATTLSITINGETFTQDWDGDCSGESICQAMRRVADKINASSTHATATAFGKYLFIRHKLPGVDLVIEAGGDYNEVDYSLDYNVGGTSWTEQFNNEL